MKRKVITLSMIAGIFILGLCVKSAVGSSDAAVMENAALEESIVSEEADGLSEPEKRESEENEEAQPEEVQAEQEPEEVAVPELVTFKKPVVKLNGEEGELSYDWNYNSVRVDADTFLFVSGCYFPEQELYQKIFFLAEAPLYFPREVFRQDSKDGNEQPHRIEQMHSVDGGYVYESDGMLYFLDGNVQKTSLLCDLYELMGDAWLFSVGTFRTCDVTADTARMIACTDEGLYEYDLKNGNRKLLEPSEFEPHAYVLDENDCVCGFREYRFFGPVRVEYAPDGQSYAYLTGTEEADWGDLRGAVLRSGEGETLYQKETENVYDFKWVESEDTSYLAVFYTEKDENGIADVAWLMDRIDVSTGEVMTFEAPKKIYIGSGPWCIVGFLDADTLLYINWRDDTEEGKNDESVLKAYRLSSGEWQDLEIAGDVEWETMVFDGGGYNTIPVRYPK